MSNKKRRAEEVDGIYRSIYGESSSQMSIGVFFLKGGGLMEKLFYSADEVKEMLGISKSKAYAVIHSLNDELRKKGYITFAGKVNRNYFMEKIYGMTAGRSGQS